MVRFLGPRKPKAMIPRKRKKPNRKKPSPFSRAGQILKRKLIACRNKRKPLTEEEMKQMIENPD